MTGSFVNIGFFVLDKPPIDTRSSDWSRDLGALIPPVSNGPPYPGGSWTSWNRDGTIPTSFGDWLNFRHIEGATDGVHYEVLYGFTLGSDGGFPRVVTTFPSSYVGTYTPFEDSDHYYYYGYPSGDHLTGYRQERYSISKDAELNSIVFKSNPLHPTLYRDLANLSFDFINDPFTFRDITSFSIASLVSRDPNATIRILGSEYDDFIRLDPTHPVDLWMGGGNDSLWGGNLDDVIGGYTGNDTIFGGGGNDLIEGSYDNDLLYGGTGRDVFFFRGARENTHAAFLQAKTPVNKGNDAEVVVRTLEDGTDRIKDGEIAQFSSGEHSLAKFYILIDRNDNDGDGIWTATGRIFENGKEITSKFAKTSFDDNLIFDTLTPIPVGTYAAFYRQKSSGSATERLELEDWGGSLEGHIQQQAANGTLLYRTNIQIHGGNSNGKTEGCFLPSLFMPAFYEYVKKQLDPGSQNFPFLNERYYPVIPITVQVTGTPPQPHVVGANSSTNDRIERTAFVTFDVKGNAGPIKDKMIEVFFKVLGGVGAAKKGVDWDFKVSGPGPKPTEVLGEDGLPKKVYSVMISTDGNGTMLSKVSIPVTIFADSSVEARETIRFQIVDFDLWTRSSRGWKLYQESLDRVEDYTPGETSNVEDLLFGATAASRIATLAIAADPVTASNQSQHPDLASLETPLIGSLVDHFIF